MDGDGDSLDAMASAANGARMKVGHRKWRSLAKREFAQTCHQKFCHGARPLFSGIQFHKLQSWQFHGMKEIEL
jgi:hypothetical protein